MAWTRSPMGGHVRPRALKPNPAAASAFVSKHSRPARKLQGTTAQAQSSALDATNPLNSTEGEGYDVYIAESPKKLEEGIEKHIISVFVADESGLINRVAGVFGRRGVNIESLAVGLTADKALFTIVTLGSRSTMSTLVKNLSKLVKVRHVEDITYDNRLDRELALFKMRASHGSKRTEILELMKIFDGKVVDVGPDALTIAVSGDPGKLYAFEQGMRRFDLIELARTGRIALRKSDDQLDLGTMGWAPGMVQQAGNLQRLGQAAAAPLQSTDEADVYMVDKRNQAGVWNVQNILDPVSTAAAADADFVPYTLSIEVGDYPGVLNEVTGVLARRGYNIQSLAVGTSETKGCSRITTVIPGQERSIMNLIQQLQKMVVVQKVTNLSAVPHVARELMLVKVRCTPGQRSEIKDIAEIFGGTVSHMTRQTITLELVGSQDTMLTVQDVLEPYGVLEVARTGRVALTRESQVDSKLIQKSGLGSFV